MEKTLRSPWQKKTAKKIKIRTYNLGEIKGTLSREEIYDGIDTIYTANDKDFKDFSEIKAVNPFV